MDYCDWIAVSCFVPCLDSSKSTRNRKFSICPSMILQFSFVLVIFFMKCTVLISIGQGLMRPMLRTKTKLVHLIYRIIIVLTANTVYMYVLVHSDMLRNTTSKVLYQFTKHKNHIENNNISLTFRWKLNPIHHYWRHSVTVYIFLVFLYLYFCCTWKQTLMLKMMYGVWDLFEPVGLGNPVKWW